MVVKRIGLKDKSVIIPCHLREKAIITLYAPGPALHNNVPAAGPSNFNFPDADVFSHPSEQFRSALCPDPDHFYEVAKELAAQIPNAKIHTGLYQFSADVLIR